MTLPAFGSNWLTKPWFWVSCFALLYAHSFFCCFLFYLVCMYINVNISTKWENKRLASFLLLLFNLIHFAQLNKMYSMALILILFYSLFLQDCGSCSLCVGFRPLINLYSFEGYFSPWISRALTCTALPSIRLWVLFLWIPIRIRVRA